MRRPVIVGTGLPSTEAVILKAARSSPSDSSRSTRSPPLLRERDWGGFTGRYIPDLKGEPWPDDIESLEALRARAAKFLDYIRAEFPSQVVLAVGHGIINKAVQSVFYDKPMQEIKPMANAEVRVLELV